MPGRLRGPSGVRSEPLTQGWEFAGCAPGAVADAAGLATAPLEWIATTVPSTVASSLRAAGRWSLDSPARRFDAEDWWYRARFSCAAAEAGAEQWLCFDGLATAAEVWLNGEPLLASEGMFTAHECRVDGRLRPSNELAIRFRSLDALLAVKRPRARWKAPMVENQQLRWWRTTLLGRTPGWSPSAAAVGPWRAVRLEHRQGAFVRDLVLRTDATGLLALDCSTGLVVGGAVTGADLVLRRHDREVRFPLDAPDPGSTALTARVHMPDAELWWPHTHGEAALYEARLVLRHVGGESVADLGPVGFRTVEVRTDGGGFELAVNGVPVFCRGACWTPLDVVSLQDDEEVLDQVFARLVECGMNVVRVGGTMTYASDAFLDRADAAGVLIWQDLMFANMDYPEDDAGFMAQVQVEVRQQLARLSGRASVAVLCGNSEGEQQAAMFGATRDRWEPTLFHSTIPALAASLCPGVVYWPSSAHGGAFPHQANAGTSSYYGVGAYLRPLEDARRAEVRFASECLAFANIPDETSLARMPGGLGTRVHHPAWKARTPRDLGAGWDFDDVRDHYLARYWGADPLALRYADHGRYLELSREVSGEVMAATFSEWRRKRSLTSGALIWFLQDLWHGAGWGVLDASGRPKAAWHHLRRALAPLAISISDEGTNGLALHLVNDRPAAFRGTVELTLLRGGDQIVGRASAPVAIPGHGAEQLAAESLFDGFRDLSWAYRFGPAPHNVVVAELRDESGTARAHAFHFVDQDALAREPDVGLAAMVSPRDDGRWDLLVTTRRFARAVRIDIPGFEADDDHFHLAPGAPRQLVLRARAGSAAIADAGAPAGKLFAMNSEASTRVAVP